MEPTSPWLTNTLFRPNEQASQEQLLPSDEAGRTIKVKTGAMKHPTGNLIKPPLFQPEGKQPVTQHVQRQGLSHFRHTLPAKATVADQPTEQLQRVTGYLEKSTGVSFEDINTQYLPIMTHRPSQLLPDTPPSPFPHDSIRRSELERFETLKQPRIDRAEVQPTRAIAGHPTQQKSSLTRSKALFLIALLCLILLQTLQPGSQEIFGSQGWAYRLGGPSAPQTNLLNTVSNQIRDGKTTLTPQQYINTIIQSMTLNQKLGQMMLVQFVGADFSLDLSTMISQYNVGSVLLLTGNHNIVNKSQLTSLTQQIQHSSTLPMAISLDQEGGLVDRLADLDGPRPSAAKIAAKGDPTQAIKAGEQDAQGLSRYGINLQLAPVVDVGTPYSVLQQQGRTFGKDANTITKMAGAYLQGLQKSGKVIGTLKHFPGLGSSTTDPHKALPILNHTQKELNQIDWAPYKNLIDQGLVHAIMVTHELVTAIDNTTPASLSSKLITGVLRQQMGFQEVIMTDSLTMEGVSAYYSAKQAAVLAVKAGSDIIMGADTPSSVATMTQGIKEAISTGEISQQRIDQSIFRILMMKYQMGLLTLPQK